LRMLLTLNIDAGNASKPCTKYINNISHTTINFIVYGTPRLILS